MIDTILNVVIVILLILLLVKSMKCSDGFRGWRDGWRRRYGYGGYGGYGRRWGRGWGYASPIIVDDSPYVVVDDQFLDEKEKLLLLTR